MGCQGSAHPSNEPRDRPRVRGLPVAEVEHHLVHPAPAPALGRVIALDHRMARAVEMRPRMAVRAVVAAADMAADPAEPQMHPPVAGLQTLLAAARARYDLLDQMLVRAGFGHGAHSLGQTRPRSSSSPPPLTRSMATSGQSCVRT